MAKLVGSPTPKSNWSAEYWAKKGDVKLYLYRKRLLAPEPGARPLPVLFLVHGSSASGRSSFDLQVAPPESRKLAHERERPSMQEHAAQSERAAVGNSGSELGERAQLRCGRNGHDADSVQGR